MKRGFSLIVFILVCSLNGCGQAINRQNIVLNVKDNLFSFTCPDGWYPFLPRDTVITLIHFQVKDNSHSPAIISVSSLIRNDASDLNALKQVLEENRKGVGAKLITYSINQDGKIPCLTTTFLISNSKVNNVVQDIGFLYKGKICLISLTVDKSQQEQYSTVPATIFQSVSLH